MVLLELLHSSASVPLLGALVGLLVLFFFSSRNQGQDQVLEELSSMIWSRQVKVEDRKNLPYTDAVIHETQRLANALPMSLPHTTSQDVTFQGYFIKRDETEWESPLSFNPSHFLDEDGKFVKRDAFLPFSAGRRACVGESLARMELLLFFTTLLQRFRFTPPPGVTEEDLDLTPTWGLTLNPSPHQLCAHRRVEAES
ncbi:cytochrome P450 2K1-like [Gadus chalcogrammus]|uniref:cytochrome P450 2K1-like n=1 Tax=Gadus chalcogrammus TaxID=1042646 RepID=UPI0024C4565E|nr:cytochrome P450 2K1-like [Gadus chalcogrammus]